MPKEPDELLSRVNILARHIQHDLDVALAPTTLSASNYYFILKPVSYTHLTLPTKLEV